MTPETVRTMVADALARLDVTEPWVIDAAVRNAKVDGNRVRLPTPQGLRDLEAEGARWWLDHYSHLYAPSDEKIATDAEVTEAINAASKLGNRNGGFPL